MKDHTPKYNFRSYESLITDATTLPNQATTTETSYEPIQTNPSRKGKLNSSSNNNSKKSIKAGMNTSDCFYNASFEKNTKDFEKKIKVIKHANSFHSNTLTERHFAKKTLENSVKKLTTFLNLNRIESSSMASLSKGYLKEQDLLSYKTTLIEKEAHYLKNKLPFLQDEVNQMKKDIESNKAETKAIRGEMMQLQRETLMLNDDVKRMNKLNSDSLTSKDSINSTLELIKRHNERLREMIREQNNKTGELVHSVNVLAKNMERHVNGIASNRKVFEKSLY